MDLLILSTFHNFRTGKGFDMSTGVLQCADNEYVDHFGQKYRFIDFIDFFTFARIRLGTCQMGFSNMPNTNMTSTLREIVDYY
ncbi:hypothetical protein Y032_0198g1634 [Ancylostoma ceylanicum]|uniref:Uncharacterized protein n=1 Tax=Ancylostoma ceylanicum TaxID=53326 RepID=A0A016SP03_9BILA|nr:hypothetical protein Y032_0198g1634 [Ancylostoma ceylanicum]